ncbi:DUF4352 domain-containing protein [Skermania sp. ID1734]|uniref:DUF4352 domain-containing protein n=1 Tax=Skermania sp. ID1734 TaxID=2597516 RepID=UPI00163D5D0D|nr:DUF4352 domain-containing protein [Skermania sp. ID1734]
MVHQSPPPYGGQFPPPPGFSQPPPANWTPPPNYRNGFGITALVLAIIGLVFGLVPLTGFIALILGLLAILFGVLGFGRVRRGIASNRVMSGFGIGIGAVATALGVWGMTIFFNAVDDISHAFDDVGSPAASLAPSVEAEEHGPGSRERPLHIGDAATLPDWTVVVNSVNRDAQREVLSENQFNDPPSSGSAYVMANVTTTYKGPKTGNVQWDLDFKVLGSAGNTFDSSNHGCGVVPDALGSNGELYPGASATGNICVEVPQAQLDRALWVISKSLSLHKTAVFVTVG